VGGADTSGGWWVLFETWLAPGRLWLWVFGRGILGGTSFAMLIDGNSLEYGVENGNIVGMGVVDGWVLSFLWVYTLR